MMKRYFHIAFCNYKQIFFFLNRIIFKTEPSTHLLNVLAFAHC